MAASSDGFRSLRVWNRVAKFLEAQDVLATDPSHLRARIHGQPCRVQLDSLQQESPCHPAVHPPALLLDLRIVPDAPRALQGHQDALVQLHIMTLERVELLNLELGQRHLRALGPKEELLRGHGSHRAIAERDPGLRLPADEPYAQPPQPSDHVLAQLKAGEAPQPTPFFFCTLLYIVI